jgi:hypothetical protein
VEAHKDILPIVPPFVNAHTHKIAHINKSSREIDQRPPQTAAFEIALFRKSSIEITDPPIPYTRFVSRIHSSLQQEDGRLIRASIALHHCLKYPVVFHNTVGSDPWRAWKTFCSRVPHLSFYSKSPGTTTQERIQIQCTSNHHSAFLIALQFALSISQTEVTVPVSSHECNRSNCDCSMQSKSILLHTCCCNKKNTNPVTIYNKVFMLLYCVS